jgi:galactitol-specific phosphotransferase system IIB component
MATATAREKRHRRIQKTKWEQSIPQFNPIDYTLSMVRMMSFFAVEVENKEKQEIAIEYWKENGLDVTGLARLADYWFVQVGPLCWMHDNDIALDQCHIDFIGAKYKHLKSIVPVIKTEKSEKIDDPRVIVEDKFNDHLSDIDVAIDTFIISGTDFDVKNYLTKHQVSAKIANRLFDSYKTMANEAEMIQTDEEVKNAFDYMTPRKQKKYVEFMRTILTACATIAKKAKVTKKVRVQKEKPAGVIVSKLKYQKDAPEFGIKSELPTKIIGASEVWVFSTRYRKLFVYRAQDGLQLSVKGTTLLNWNPETSSGKILRKPLEILPSFATATRRPLKVLFDTIRTSVLEPTGRFSDETIILKVF